MNIQKHYLNFDFGNLMRRFRQEIIFIMDLKLKKILIYILEIFLYLSLELINKFKLDPN